MPVFKHRKDTFVYIHVPKTGGTTVEMIARNNGWTEFYSARGLNTHKDPLFKLTPQHMHIKLMKEFLDFSKADSVFTLVRNPFQRLKSEYYWQLKKNTNLNENPKEWLNRTFDEYSVQHSIYDNHIRPQVDFVEGLDQIEIFKLEEHGLEKIARKLDRKTIKSFLTKKLPHSKVSVKKPEIEKEFEFLRNKIEKFYKTDYEYFRFEK